MGSGAATQSPPNPSTLRSLVLTHLRRFHSGRHNRCKVRHLSAHLFGTGCGHGSGREVLIRNTIADLVARGVPIGSAPGPRGGVYYFTSEDERRQALRALRKQVNALKDRMANLRNVFLSGY